MIVMFLNLLELVLRARKQTLEGRGEDGKKKK